MLPLLCQRIKKISSWPKEDFQRPVGSLRDAPHNTVMHTIQIPDEQFAKLTGVAQAAGYADLPAMISALAEQPILDPRGELTDKELSDSVAMIERGNAEIEAGGGIDAEEAFERIRQKHSFVVDENDPNRDRLVR